MQLRELPLVRHREDYKFLLITEVYHASGGSLDLLWIL